MHTSKDWIKGYINLKVGGAEGIAINSGCVGEVGINSDAANVKVIVADDFLILCARDIDTINRGVGEGVHEIGITLISNGGEACCATGDVKGGGKGS